MSSSSCLAPLAFPSQAVGHFLLKGSKCVGFVQAVPETYLEKGVFFPALVTGHFCLCLL